MNGSTLSDYHLGTDWRWLIKCHHGKFLFKIGIYVEVVGFIHDLWQNERSVDGWRFRKIPILASSLMFNQIKSPFF